MMMGTASYRDRAATLYRIVRDTRVQIETTLAVGSIGDRLATINYGVESINKICYCFSVAPDLFEQLDTVLNQPYQQISTCPTNLNYLLTVLLNITRTLETTTAKWVERYA